MFGSIATDMMDFNTSKKATSFSSTSSERKASSDVTRAYGRGGMRDQSIRELQPRQQPSPVLKLEKRSSYL